MLHITSDFLGELRVYYLKKSYILNKIVEHDNLSLIRYILTRKV